jgi:hypothetical protein
MKKLFILSLLFIFAATAHAHQNNVLRGDTIDIIIIDPDGPLPGPYHAPIQQDVYGVVSQTTQSISISVAQDIIIDRVRIYRNGQLAVSDDTPTPINNTLYYNLSAIGSGFYSILLEADDGTIYQGYFTLL